MIKEMTKLNVVFSTQDLYPLPPMVRSGVIAIVVFAFLSFITTVWLISMLTIRMWHRWCNKVKVTSQFTVLIYNLLLADILQSVAFMLSVRWIRDNGVFVNNATCRAQGWFVSIGDLASGMWCLSIALHTFGMVLFRYRPSGRVFAVWVLFIWIFNFVAAGVSVALRPNLFVRAGAWCWVDAGLPGIRLWLHYFWIFVCEFGVIILYGILFVIVYIRTQRPVDKGAPITWVERKTMFSSSVTPEQAQRALWLMIVYPLVYIICTLPLASARMSMMAGKSPSLLHLCISGAMITCNGWLDVLLYSITRRIYPLCDGPAREDYGLENFVVPFVPENGSQTKYRTTTTITAGPWNPRPSHAGSDRSSQASQRGSQRGSHRRQSNPPSFFESIRNKLGFGSNRNSHPSIGPITHPTDMKQMTMATTSTSTTMTIGMMGERKSYPGRMSALQMREDEKVEPTESGRSSRNSDPKTHLSSSDGSRTSNGAGDAPLVFDEMVTRPPMAHNHVHHIAGVNDEDDDDDDHLGHLHQHHSHHSHLRSNSDEHEHEHLHGRRSASQSPVDRSSDHHKQSRLRVNGRHPLIDGLTTSTPNLRPESEPKSDPESQP